MTEATPASDAEKEAFWREFLTRGDPKERRVRGLFRRIPNGPRCMMCAAPFAGLGAPAMRALGRAPSSKNPTMCNACFRFMEANHGGAEVECTLLFADIRGSTTLAEGMTAGQFRRLLDRFYAVASSVVFAHEGSVDKFVGDELVALYFPLLSGHEHPARAVETATALLRATGHADPGGPWVPLGAGVHTGPAWVGAIGDDVHTELTVVGDTVNTAARLATAAAAGEVLVSFDAAVKAGLDVTPAGGFERRALDLKGKAVPTEVVVVPVGAGPRPAVPAGA
jgi:adenylate cyclase